MNVTEGLRALMSDAYDHEEEDGTTAPEYQPVASPIKTATTPPSTRVPSARQRLRRYSDHNGMSGETSRPKLRRRVITAPPGTLRLRSPTKPQPPRRAISLRVERASQHPGSRFRRMKKSSPATPRPSYLGRSAAKSNTGRKMTSRKAPGKTGLEPDRQVWRLSGRATTQCQLMSETCTEGSKPPLPAQNSFSAKPRVRETLDRKKLDPLRTLLFDDSDEDLPDTPNSMTTTPMELYGPPSSESTMQSSMLEGSGSIASESSFSDVTLSRRREKHFSLPLIAYDRWKIALNRMSLDAKAKGKSRGTLMLVYEPGPIRIEDKITAIPQRRSLAPRDSLDVLDRYDEKEPNAKRYSDVVALDGIVCFFQELGIAAESSEECLDRYWVPDGRMSRGLMRRKDGAPAAEQVQAVVSPSRSLSRRSVALAWQTARQREGRLPPSPETPGRRGLRSLLKSHRTLV